MHLEAGNVKLDRRIERRELTTDEINCLIKFTSTSGIASKPTSLQRATLYLTALGTGLRASELSNLTKQHLLLDDELPSITVDAVHDKSRRGYELQISRALANVLQTYCCQMKLDQSLWPGKWAAQKRASKILKHDLRLTRQTWIDAADSETEKQQREDSELLKYRNRNGQADFHSLRHTYLSRLGCSGASVKIMQDLARHSTPELTISRYTHTNKQDLHQAVELMDQDIIQESDAKQGESLVATLVAHISDDKGKKKQISDDNSGQQSTENQQMSESSNAFAEQRVAEKSR